MRIFRPRELSPSTVRDTTLDSFSILGCLGRRSYGGLADFGENCAFCRQRMTRKPFDTQHAGHMYQNRLVNYCERCGWWAFSESGDDCNTPFTTHFCSILQSFDLRSAEVPVDVLALELPKWIEKIHHLNPKRMEDIVGRILSSVWKCEVRHMGYTKDGGTDLLILNGEQPVAVQVKRRASRTHREGVNFIHQFLGAAQLKDHRRLMYVTTAERFTKGAVEAAELSQEKNLVEAFDLVSMREIRAFLPAMPNSNPWDYAVRRANDHICNVPTIPNPYQLRRHRS